MNKQKYIIISVFTVSIIVSLAQYLFNNSLGYDESMLCLNFAEKGFTELTKPLDNLQSAPVLFLLAEKSLLLLIPNSEYGLRLLPLMCFIIAQLIFYKLLLLFPLKKHTLLIAYSLFAFSSFMHWYSNEIKQYMCDVLSLVAIYYLVLKPFKTEIHRYILLSIMGALMIFLSNAAPIILFSVFIYLLYNSISDFRKTFVPLFLTGAVWFLSFGCFYFLFVKDHPIGDYMVSFWSIFSTFPDFTSLRNMWQFVVHAPYYFICLDMNRQPEKFYILLVLMIINGIFYAIKNKQYRLLMLTLSPLVIHLALSSLKMYPFFPRFYLYIYPLFFILSAYGVTELVNTVKNFGQRRYLLTGITVIIPSLSLASLLLFTPQRHQKVRDSIAYIEQHKQPGDVIYCHWETIYAYKVYELWGVIKPDNDVVEGSLAPCKNLDFPDNAKRIWFLYAADVFNQQQCIANKLDSLNYNQIKEYRTFKSSVLLFSK